MSLTKLNRLAIASIVILALLGGGGYRQVKWHKKSPQDDKSLPFYWMHYHRLNGYYNGVQALVKPHEYDAENR